MINNTMIAIGAIHNSLFLNIIHLFYLLKYTMCCLINTLFIIMTLTRETICNIHRIVYFSTMCLKLSIYLEVFYGKMIDALEKQKAAIKSAFIQLLTEKDLEKITIQDITQRADINRGTFYLHYGR
ncbi:transcriptional regulator [Staphylococcus gallinarum]|uniref:Transcriptional regulator n=1 Tax=Staphylococcus gallinarum TaxID=1293 RepID=A0A380FNF5_STAGA|nr:transcriptional regulator [Staphylococcus gallinarum]